MNFKAIFASVAMAMLTTSVQAGSVTLTFDDLGVNTILSDQYAGLGAIFGPNAFSGAGGPNGDWATNTDMTIVSSTGADVGELGSPPLVSGNILHGFNGWLAEDGDPSFFIDFLVPVVAVSADFAGVGEPAAVQLFAYDGSALLGVVGGSQTGQFTLGFSGSRITRVVIAPGTFVDWVGVDNIRYTQLAVPEPPVVFMFGLGLVLMACARRRVGELRLGQGLVDHTSALSGLTVATPRGKAATACTD